MQCRKSDIEMIKFLKKINHENTYICATAEREVLKTLEGDCNTAVGAYCSIEDKKIEMIAELFSVDGKKKYYFKSSKELNLAKELGKDIGNILKKKSEGNYKK